MLRPLPRLLTVLGLLALLSGASSVSCSFNSSDGNEDDDDLDFVTQLSVESINGTPRDSFERGELMQLVLTVRNRSDRAVTVDFSATRTFDFVVVRENTSDIVWQLSDDSAPPSPLPTTLEFAANESRTFTTTWNQIGNDGAQASSGSYEARGVLIFPGFDLNVLRIHPLGSPLERFVIR